MLINNKLFDEEKVKILIEDIKKKKELKQLNEEFIREHLFEFLQQEHKLAKSLLQNFNRKSASYKKLLKNVRARLRRVYGLFRKDEELKERKFLVEKLLKTNKKKQILDKILATHSSTKERLLFYEKLYKKIFSITGKPRSIIDLGCGINPFSINYMKLKKSSYYAYDLSLEEMDNLNHYFKLLHQENKLFTGKANILDILHWVKLQKLEPVDICFLFKMTDVLDRGKGHKATETVVKNIPAKFIVVSFPTTTISGKKMNFPRRKWIELMCKRLGYEFKIIKFSNEIFYVIKKKVLGNI